MDFFAGSGTTGHAVWDLNKEDGGNRKFILVQLDEEVQDSPREIKNTKNNDLSTNEIDTISRGKEIKKEFPTVADICIERLRRVSEKYKKEIASASPRNDINNQDLDLRFLSWINQISILRMNLNLIQVKIKKS